MFSKWIDFGFSSDCLKHKLEIDSYRQVADLGRGIEQFSDEQTALGLFKPLKLCKKCGQIC